MTTEGALPLATQTIYKGRVFRVNVDRVRLPHGRDVQMDVIRHPGSVVLLPMPDADHVVLVRQYRHAIGRWIWELPAGSLEEGEAPENAARRECLEEVGLEARAVERLASFYPTPGYCDEEMLFFRLTGLASPPEGTLVAQDEDESLEVRTFALGEARELVRRGDIVDLKTAVGLTLI